MSVEYIFSIAGVFTVAHIYIYAYIYIYIYIKILINLYIYIYITQIINNEKIHILFYEKRTYIYIYIV